jgi:hypothetical protein
MLKEMADYPGPRLSREQMRAFLEYGWGDIGLAVFTTWEEFNIRFFADQLSPIPIVLVATSPHGHWVGCTHTVTTQRRAAFIALTAPYNKRLRSDRGVLLHEMIHAALVERGESPKHEHAPWCREITRLSALLGRSYVHAAPQKVQRVNGTIARVTPHGSISRRAAARWPHSIGLDLGSLLPLVASNGSAPVAAVHATEEVKEQPPISSLMTSVARPIETANSRAGSGTACSTRGR